MQKEAIDDIPTGLGQCLLSVAMVHTVQPFQPDRGAWQGFRA